jgi:hypothetical protein
VSGVLETITDRDHVLLATPMSCFLNTELLKILPLQAL